MLLTSSKPLEFSLVFYLEEMLRIDVVVIRIHVLSQKTKGRRKWLKKTVKWTKDNNDRKKNSKMKSMGRQVSLCLVFLAASPAFVKAQPVCAASPENCSENADVDDAEQQFEEESCGLWLAESILDVGKLATFTGIDMKRSATVGEPDIHVPVFDPNMNEYSPYHELLWDAPMDTDLILQNLFKAYSFLPGVPSTTPCSEHLGNVHRRRGEEEDAAGVHRSKDPSAGSFSYRYNISFETARSMLAGEEFFTSCGGTSDDSLGEVRRLLRPVEWLQEHALCIDNIVTKPSTLPGVGRGGFVKRKVRKGGIITSSPVVTFDASQLQIVEQSQRPEQEISYTEHVVHQQLLLNYCFRHPNSTLLILPYGPGVNSINHHATEPNAVLHWSKSRYNDQEALELPAHELFHDRQGQRLILDYVALRDIEAGEEIFIDYGQEWQSAWEEHVSAWEMPQRSESYLSASAFQALAPLEPIRTSDEQNHNPYPSNIHTACAYAELDETEADAQHWHDQNDNCVRPCKIVAREKNPTTNRYVYEAEVLPIRNQNMNSECELSDTKTISGIPDWGVRLVDKEYSTDQHLKSAFRHTMGVPSHLFPENWLQVEKEPMGSFLLEDLKPGQIENIKWSDTGEIVTKNGNVMGLLPKIRETLMEYADRKGITDILRHVTYRGNGLEPPSHKDVPIDGIEWHIQRPESRWHSNMHWMSPTDEHGHADFLKMLSAAGFDEVLQQIGEHFGYKHLTAFQLTYVAVSYCDGGYFHYDIGETGSRVMNVMIPLIVVNNSSPELYFSDGITEEFRRGRLKFRLDVANLIGDDAGHATAMVDYRLPNPQMRMVATICLGEIDENNVDAISHFIQTQNYPPPGRPDLLLNMAGIHWSRDDPNIKLPSANVDDFELTLEA